MTPTQETIRNLLIVATLLPLFSSAIVILATRRVLFKGAGLLATGVMAVAFGCAVVAAFKWLTTPDAERLAFAWNLPWIPIPGNTSGGGWLYLGVMVDGLTIAMMTMVTGISMLVHLYSIGYMAGDKRYNLFFSYLSLFTFSMLGIVIANSIMMLFVFWELVGLTSYLLIGFWFEKRGPQLACKKAFVMNRVGDMGFLIGFGILFYKLGGNMLLPAVNGGMFEAIKAQLAAEHVSITNPPMWLTAAGIGLFFGAIGKSAQFPLHTWLPDAMEGPTPVSSIVHSATMVAAGVYLTGRIYPILTPGAHLFISTIGLITLVMAACMALVMTDIKRVLAYSTLSQLGYMILGLGTGSYVFALYHLFTHAFFKCCLFQCSGSVIHAAHHQQDMRFYGGLWKKMPITGTCYLLCTLAIAGVCIPYTEMGISGFYSKDGIIAGTVNYGDAMWPLLGQWAKLFFWGPTAVAYLTAFYMARSFALTFLGKPRDQHLYDHAHEAPWQMWAPQVVLAAMALLAAPWGTMITKMPWQKLIDSTRESMITAGATWVQAGELHELGHGIHYVHKWLFAGIAPLVVLAVGVLFYAPGMKFSSKIAAIPGVNLIYKWWLNKFYFDGLYDVFLVSAGKALAGTAAAFDKYIVDGLVNLAGFATKVSAMFTGLFDNRVVDGIVNGAATAAQNGGEVLRSTQPGRVRAYVLVMFGSATVVTLAVVVVAIVTR